MRSLYLKILSVKFLIKFLSPEFATSIKMHIPYLLSRIMKSGLLLGIVLSVHTCRFHDAVNGHTNVRCLIWLQYPFCFCCRRRCFCIIIITFLYARSQNCEKRLLPLSCLSARNNSDPTAPIFIKFENLSFLKTPQELQYFIWKPTYSYETIMFNSSYNEKCL